MSLRVTIQYFAILRERAGRSTETVTTTAANPGELYDELSRRLGLDLPRSLLRVAVNEEFATWDRPLQDGDRIVFIPPVAGG